MMVLYPYFSALFVIIPILATLQYWRYRHRSRQWRALHHPSQWHRMIQFSDSGHFFWQKAWLLLALSALIIALMRPQYGQRFEPIERTGRSIVFVVDTSLSMLAEDGAPTRLDLIKYHIQQLMNKTDQDQISIVAYASRAYTYLPLTHDVPAMNLFLNDMSVGMVGSGGSNINDALTVVTDAMADTPVSSRVVVIFSDGEFMPSLNPTILNTIRSKMNAVDVLVVGVGSPTGEPIPLTLDPATGTIVYKKDANGRIVVSRQDTQQLRTLATQMNGQFVDGQAVSPIVADTIYRQLSKAETTQIAQTQRIVPIDRYHWFVLMALICWTIGMVGPTIRKTLPSVSVMIFPFLMILSPPTLAAHPGHDAYNKKDYATAEQIFQQALIDDPNAANIHYNLGNTYYKMNRMDAAIQAYTDALPTLSGPEKINTQYNIGTAYLKKSQWDAAINAYKTVIKQDPSHIKARQNLEWALRQLSQSPSPSNENSDPRDDTDNNSSDDTDTPSPDSPPTDPSTTPNSSDNSSDRSSEGSPRPQPLTDQQIQYLVDQAENAARQNQQRTLKQLSNEDVW